MNMDRTKKIFRKKYEENKSLLTKKKNRSKKKTVENQKA